MIQRCARRATAYLAILFLITSPAWAQSTRDTLAQNTTPSPRVLGNIITSAMMIADTNQPTGITNFLSTSTVRMEGHFYVTANIPTLTTCGTNPAVTARSNSSGGEITLGTGSPTACTLTWATASNYTNDTWCTFTAGSSATAAISGGWYVSAHSATAVTLTIGAATDGAVFEYTCFGN